MKNKLTFCIVFLLTAFNSMGQTELDSFAALNTYRIQTDKGGMVILTAWGATNLMLGGLGYSFAHGPETKYYFEMDALWGVVNSAIGVAGIGGIRQQIRRHYSCASYLSAQDKDERLYLANAGLDILYMGTGAFLTERGRSENKNPIIWRGFGSSVITQGAFLFVFDNVMYLLHKQQNKKWYRILNQLCGDRPNVSSGSF